VARIEFRRVGKTFATRDGELTALAGIDVAVADKEFVALNLVAGFDVPTSGTILVDGARVTGPGPDRGVVFQHTALFPWLSVADNIAFGLKLRANKGKGSPHLVTQRMLERTGLLPFRARLPAELSGGMRQRAAIASVLAINPSTLLMDEPFGALDALTRSVMQDFLLEIWEQERKTALLVTHDIDEAIYLADRTIVMTAHPGRIREIIDVDLPRPRRYEMRSHPRFIELRDHITGIVRSEALAGDAGSRHAA
jgi:ABC-type nitrate/sulfonate/bicarbonate transport system ATPase subunit